MKHKTREATRRNRSVPHATATWNGTSTMQALYKDDESHTSMHLMAIPIKDVVLRQAFGDRHFLQPGLKVLERAHTRVKTGFMS